MKTKILMAFLAGMVILAGCKNSGRYEADKAAADTVSVSTDTSQQPKLVKTAGMGFKVKSVQQSAEKIAALTSHFSGMVVHHRINSTANGSHDVKISDDSVMRISAFYTTGEMTVRIPSEKLETYLDSVGHLGIYVNTSSMDVEDKSLDYLSAKLKLNSRKELVSRRKQGKVVIKDPSAVLNLKDDLVDEQISNRKIDDAVKYSVVNLNFYQSNTIIKEIVANDDPSAYSISFFKRLGLAFENGWLIFKELLILLTDIWVFILGGVLIWLALRNYKKKAPLKANVG